MSLAQMLDVDGDGYVTANDFNLIAYQYGLDPNTFLNLFYQLDSNGNGYLDQYELDQALMYLFQIIGQYNSQPNYNNYGMGRPQQSFGGPSGYGPQPGFGGPTGYGQQPGFGGPAPRGPTSNFGGPARPPAGPSSFGGPRPGFNGFGGPGGRF